MSGVLIDEVSLFLASGIGGAALTLTLLSGWMNSRNDRFLLSWMVGIAVLSVGVLVYTLGPEGNLLLTAAAFALEIGGFALIHIGGRQFVGRPVSRLRLALLALTVPVVSLPILAGFDGAGIMFYNFLAGGILAATAADYFLARDESPTTIAGLVLLYGLTSASFVACGAVLLQEGAWTLGTRPSNWAETFNAIACIVGVTGVGALSLSMIHARTARRHREEARTDALTGLLNRRALFDAMTQDALRPGDAVVVFDLDRFKSINDVHGHATGDEVLRRFANALREHQRPEDVSARTGGEEFVLVIRNASLQLAAATAERVRAQFFADSMETPRGLLTFTSSAGVALANGSGERFETVLHRADMSLYRAKNGGRDRVATELQAVA